MKCVTTRLAAYWSVMIYGWLVVHAQPTVADESPEDLVSRVVRAHQRSLELIHDLDVSVSINLVGTGSSNVDPPTPIAECRWIYSRENSEDRIIYREKDQDRLKPDTVFDFYWKTGDRLLEHTGVPYDADRETKQGDFCQIHAPLASGTPKAFRRDIAGWLMLRVLPSYPGDPRLELVDLVTLSPKPPICIKPEPGATTWRLVFDWPKGIPSSSTYLGTITVDVDEKYGFAITAIEKDYSVSFPDDPKSEPAKVHVLQRVVTFKEFESDSVFIPIETTNEIQNTGDDASKKLVRCNVTDIQLNQPNSENRFGFSFPVAATVHYLGTDDGTIADKWALWGSNDRPEAEFNTLKELLRYQGNKVLGSEDGAAPRRVDKQKKNLFFWVIAANVIVLLALMMIMRRKRKQP